MPREKGYATHQVAISEDKSTIIITQEPITHEEHSASAVHIWVWDRVSKKMNPIVVKREGPAHLPFTLAITTNGLRFARLHDYPTPSQVRGRGTYKVYNARDGSRVWTWINPWTWSLPSHRSGDALALEDEWVCFKGDRECRPLVWLPPDYRPDIEKYLQLSGLWSPQLQTLSVPSRTGKHSFIKLDAGQANVVCCGCGIDLEEHDDIPSAISRRANGDAKSRSRAETARDEASAGVYRRSRAQEHGFIGPLGNFGPELYVDQLMVERARYAEATERPGRSASLR